MVISKKNYYFPRFQSGPNIYQGWGPTFSRGIQMLISIEKGSGPNIPTSGSVHDWIRIG